MIVDRIDIGINAPTEVNAVVEIAVGGEPIKYELDKDSGALVVDRFLYTPMRYPGNYGFIPQTLSADGDPCDILIVNTRPLLPGSVICVRPVGVLLMHDEHGADEKIIAVPATGVSRRYEAVVTYLDLPTITREQIEHFFTHYKDLESEKWVRTGEWHGPPLAHTLIREAQSRCRNAKTS